MPFETLLVMAQSPGGLKHVLPAIILAMIMLSIMISITRRYRRCPPGRMLVIVGKTADGRPTVVQHGAAFVWPLIQDYAYLDTTPMELPIKIEKGSTEGGDHFTLRATATVAVSRDLETVQNAIDRLLGLTADAIATHARNVIEGQVNDVLFVANSALLFNRKELVARMERAVADDLPRLGLEMLSLNIEEITAGSVDI